MLEHEEILLDEEQETTTGLTYGEAWEWWQGKRWVYNAAVFGFFALVCLGIYLFFDFPVYANLSTVFLTVGVVYATLGNVVYFLGWGIEALLKRFSNIHIEDKTRNTMFWVGVGISCVPSLLLFGSMLLIKATGKL